MIMKSEKNDIIKTIVLAIIIVSICVMGVMGALSVLHVLPTPLTNDNMTLVLSFVGIIATFIVVGNYTQVSSIRDDMLDKIQIAKDEANKNLSNKADELKKDFDNKLSHVCDDCADSHIKPLQTEIENISSSLENFNSRYYTLLSAQQANIQKYLQGVLEITMKYTINKPDVLQIINEILPHDALCKVQCKGKKRPVVATIKVENNLLKFYNDKSSILIPSDEIEIINDKVVDNFDLLNSIMVLFKKVQEDTCIYKQEPMLSSLKGGDNSSSIPQDGFFQKDINKQKS